MRTTTTILLVLPTLCMFVAMSGGATEAFAVIWLLVAIACLTWGVYLRKRNRMLSWLCIVYAVVQFGLLSLPFILRPRYGGEG